MLKAIVWSYAPVAQLVEHWTLSMWRNGNSLPPTGRDAGSNPVVGSIIQESRVRVPAGAPNILLSRITAVQPALTRLVEVRILWEQPFLLCGSKSTINKIATTLLLHQKGLNIMGQPESCPVWRIGRAGTEENFKKLKNFCKKY